MKANLDYEVADGNRRKHLINVLIDSECHAPYSWDCFMMGKNGATFEHGHFMLLLVFARTADLKRIIKS